MLHWYLYIKNWMEEQKGQDIIEYAVMVALVAVVGAIIFTSISADLNVIWQKVEEVVNKAAVAV